MDYPHSQLHVCEIETAEKVKIWKSVTKMFMLISTLF